MAEQEEIVTMEEIFKQQAVLEEEANAKLLENWGDEKVCTYDKNYIKQPVYSCLTCTSNSNKQFGFCFGCSMNCHLNHEVLELFDKRDFKCDCGTPISGCQCTLPPTCDRSTNNVENKYTHNFDGKYCFCDGGYNPREDEMIQCFVCEDWFHEPCINSRTIAIPDRSVAYNDFFVCKDCYNRLPFLAYYSQCRIKLEEDVPVTDVINSVPSMILPTDSTVLAVDATADSNPLPNADAPTNPTANNPTDSDPLANPQTTSTNTSMCKCLAQAPGVMLPSAVDTFWVRGWRKQLCTCPTCRQLYISLSVSFLIEEPEDLAEDINDIGDNDEEATTTLPPDTPESVLASAPKRPYKSLLEDSAEQAFLKNPSMDHESKLNVIHGYNEMSEKLKAFLDNFARTGRVVTKEDIDNFFNELRDTKRHKGSR